MDLSSFGFVSIFSLLGAYPRAANLPDSSGDFWVRLRSASFLCQRVVVRPHAKELTRGKSKRAGFGRQHSRQFPQSLAPKRSLLGASLCAYSCNFGTADAREIQSRNLSQTRIFNSGDGIDGNSIDGIVSERDLAYGLATYGGRLPTISVSQLMTKAVIVCSPEDSVTDVMKLMTQRRIRHLPVKDGDQLVGIISIGDVLKHRLGELQVEAKVLRDYAVAARR